MTRLLSDFFTSEMQNTEHDIQSIDIPQNHTIYVVNWTTRMNIIATLCTNCIQITITGETTQINAFAQKMADFIRSYPLSVTPPENIETEYQQFMKFLSLVRELAKPPILIGIACYLLYCLVRV